MDNLSTLRQEKDFNDSFDLYIDNKKLDGFLDYFAKGHCDRNCDKCSYCDEYANKAIKYLVPVEQHLGNVDALKNTKDIMISGELFLKNKDFEKSKLN